IIKTNQSEQESQKKKKRSWNAREKLAIVGYLEKNPTASKRNTAARFNITTKQL
ncbi:20373_t:CDS:1, partial [Gigaspora margarita]